MLRLLFGVLLPVSAFAAGPVWEPGGTRCMPNFRDGNPVGYLCVKVEPGSIYDKAGIRKGDNVTKINGSSMAAVDDASFDLWKDFEKGLTATVEVERNGKLFELKKPAQ
jgi:S1-C subfamily serine protease